MTDAGTPSRGPRGWSRRPVALTGLLVLLVLVLIGGVSVFRQATRDPNQGLQTTCVDYVKMTTSQRVAVWERAGMSAADARHQLDATGIVTGCKQGTSGEGGDKAMTIGDGPASEGSLHFQIGEALIFVVAGALGLLVLLGVAVWDAARRPLPHSA